MLWRHRKHPWEPAEYSEEVIYAVRAMKDGTALPHQQQLAWRWLMFVTAAGDGFDDLSFRPGGDGPRETDFAEGKRFVGLQMRKMLHPDVLDAVRKAASAAKR
jgi:hypothetical protein